MTLEEQSPPSLEASLRRMKQLVSPRLGIARSIMQIPLQQGDPPIYTYGVEAAGPGPRGVSPPRGSSGGTGLTPAEGMVSALGEMIEGYCGAWIPRDRLVFGTRRELRRTHEVVEPARFALFSEAQYGLANFPFRRLDDDTPLYWVEGYSLVRRVPVLVPASRVYMPWPRSATEHDIGPTYSTGLAAGATREHAILSGLYECFERDAFTIFWLNDLPVRRVDLGASSPELPVVRRFREWLDRPGYDYRIYDITNDLGVPTLYVILISPAPEGPLVHVVGAASRLDGHEALFKALLESVQGKPYVLHEIRREPEWRPAADFSDVNDFTRTCKLYTVAPQLQAHLLGIADRVTAHIRADDLPHWSTPGVLAGIGELVGRLAARDYEALVVDVTTPDIAGLGLSVVRVIAPELQQLHASRKLAFLGGKRLYEVPVSLGCRPAPPPERELSMYPHPFP